MTSNRNPQGARASSRAPIFDRFDISSPIILLLSLLLAIVFQPLLERRWAVHIAAAVLLALMLLAGLTQAEIQIYLRQRSGSLRIENGKLTTRIREKDVADEKRVAEESNALQQADSKMVLVKAIKGRSAIRSISFTEISVFQLQKLTVNELRSAPPPPAVIGCIARHFSSFKKSIPMLKCRLLLRNSFCGR